MLKPISWLHETFVAINICFLAIVVSPIVRVLTHASLSTSTPFDSKARIE